MTFQVYWGAARTSNDLLTYLRSKMKAIPNEWYAAALMAHMSFEKEEIEHDVVNLGFGEENGIRYMASRLAENGLDEW